MWPNVPICRFAARAVSAMNVTIRASSLRGTVKSSRIVVGLRRASAENAFRLAAASASASASFFAIRTSRAPLARAIEAICAASSATADCEALAPAPS